MCKQKSNQLLSEQQKIKKVEVRTKSPSHVQVRREQDAKIKSKSEDGSRSPSPIRKLPIANAKPKRKENGKQNGHVYEEPVNVKITRHDESNNSEYSDEEPHSIAKPPEQHPQYTNRTPSPQYHEHFDQMGIIHAKFDHLSTSLTRMLSERLDSMEYRLDTSLNNLTQRMTIVEGQIKFMQNELRQKALKEQPPPETESQRVISPPTKPLPTKTWKETVPIESNPTTSSVDISVDTMSFINQISARFKESQKLIDQVRQTNS